MRDTKLLTFIRYQFEEKAFEAYIIQFKYIISEVAQAFGYQKNYCSDFNPSIGVIKR